MRSYFIVIVLLAIVGISAGVLLIPREEEVALMHFLDANFEKARGEYEEQLAAGDWSINVVVPLTKLYLQDGKVDDAASLMEEFVDRNPDNVEARLVLGEYYQFAQRPDDYLRNLLKLTELEPTESRFRELSDIYSFRAEPDQQVRVLRELIDRYGGGPDDLRALASLLASLQNFSEALDALRELRERFPDSIDSNVAELLVSLLSDQSLDAEALEFASAWLNANGNPPHNAARLSGLLNYKGYPRRSLELLRPYEPIVDEHPSLLAEYTARQSELGEATQAFQRLNRLFDEDRLPAEAAGIAIGLALQRQMPLRALEIADGTEISTLPSWLLVALTETAIAENDIAFARRMFERLGDEYLSERPALAAEVLLAGGDEDAARIWVDRALAVEAPSVAEKTSLARVFFRLDEHDLAIDLLRELASGDSPEPAVLSDLVQIYLAADRAREGAEFFGQLRMSDSQAIADTGWAVLSASSGNSEAVIDWLDRVDSGRIDLGLLTNLYFIAGDQSEDLLRLAAAERLIEARDTPDNRDRLLRGILDARLEGRAMESIRAVVEARADPAEIERLRQGLEELGYPEVGRMLSDRSATGTVPLVEVPIGALSELRRGTPPDPVLLAGYVVSAEAALELDLPIGETMRQAQRDILSRDTLTMPERAAATATLLSLGDDAGALDAIEVLARDQPESWGFTFFEIARRLGETDRLETYFLDRIESPDLTETERDQTLFLILDAVGPEPALPYLRENASERGGPWLFAYAEALKKLDDIETFRDFLLEFAADTTLPMETRRVMAFQLLETGARDGAEQAFLGLAADAPPTSPDVQQLLYLWGPRPKADAENWLLTRFRTATREDRAGWFQILLNSAGAARALTLTEQETFDDTDHNLGRLRLIAYLQSGDRAGFSELLGRLSMHASSQETLEEYGSLAYQESLLPLAIELFDRAATAGVLDEETSRKRALAAYFLGRQDRAATLLSQHLASFGGDIDTHQFLGELFLLNGQTVRGRENIRIALNYAREMPDETFSHQRRIGRLMVLAQEPELEVINFYEQLISRAPELLELRAEYAEFLLSRGDTGRAETVLSNAAIPVE